VIEPVEAAMNAQKCAAMPMPLQRCSIWMDAKPSV
jgi:hypothetical protein